jgi:hypothetical protein
MSDSNTIKVSEDVGAALAVLRPLQVASLARRGDAGSCRAVDQDRLVSHKSLVGGLSLARRLREALLRGRSCVNNCGLDLVWLVTNALVRARSRSALEPAFASAGRGDEGCTVGI